MSLAQQISIAAVGLVVTLVLCLAMAAVILSREHAVHAARSNLEGIAQGFADRLHRRMAIYAKQAQLVASLDALSPIWEGEQSKARSLLEQLLRSEPAIAWVGFVRPDGVIRVATGGLLEEHSVTDGAWLQAGLKGLSIRDMHGARGLAPLPYPTSDGSPVRLLEMAVPVRDRHGDVRGVLGYHLNWNWAEQIRRRVLAGLPGDQQTELIVLSSTGETLLGPPMNDGAREALQSARLPAGKRGFLTDGRGEDLQLAVSVVAQHTDDFAALGWIVVARQPAEVVLQPANDLFNSILLTGLIIGTAGVIGSILIARRVSRPIKELTTEADRVGRGSSEMRRVRGSLEVVRLSAALRSLVRRLGVAMKNSADLKITADDQAKKYNADLAQMIKLADSDALTGLLNRRRFVQHGAEFFQNFRARGQAFAIVMLDIDHFKLVNDTFGHKAGDAVIRDTGATIVQNTRPTDHVARFGGEEFVVLLQGADTAAAYEAAERIRRSVAEGRVICGGQRVAITISCGVATADAADRDIEDVIERADKALYAAKSMGRNKVAISQPDARATIPAGVS